MNISKQAIEAGARALTKWKASNIVTLSDEELTEKVLAAALEHIIPKESDHAMYSVFDTAYGDRDTHAWQNRVFRGLTAVLTHLRGEGKRAEAGTPPASQEPNPDDVERVARAIERAWTEKGPRTPIYGEQLQVFATAAIRAMNGQFWGVWDNERNEWMKMPGSETDFTTTCTAAATCVCCVQPNKSLRILPYKATESGIVVCVSKEWSKDLITSKLCVRDNTGSVRAWIQNTGDEEGDYEIAKAVDARLRLASVAAEVREAEKRGTAKCG